MVKKPYLNYEQTKMRLKQLFALNPEDGENLNTNENAHSHCVDFIA